ncbi:ferritin [Gottschalkia purinilytica]|uniref:Ferritin n=1 Tax=Gottschalkia purinilytica TaxID=1503 RepID=A0A0L0W9U9_GOTPU|nr:ferritin [Gottschalkia purinilytica]KNF08080.1 ferritin [Gottschalkia purinilytica]
MLSERLLEGLNDQINYEFLSAHYYLAMAAYCADQDLDGFANFFVVQAEEERFHAMKFYNFVNELDGRVKITGIENVKNDYESILDVFKSALAHEKTVTKRIYNLTDIATEEREHATISLLKWFVDEQVEEEASMKSILKRLERLGDDIHGVYMLDQELAQRTFVPPTNA